ncbi:MAG: hypothetical protein A2504_08875 [Bdellovibrionales bacterium RIFOXYD12_FULL_39_22]|nr:MAG: hypothetical protein A2385_13390 [Bdellovibrionales bacterium RIFOXYB1_FULL_39_21]OFZ40917.1 MAG: hypothetical protein A2485_16355 [Bdellovibrionales bacterium RIFOXYC12_FULL_39_17]OFZ44739.1 MAG: hypothetical protein A2404_10765 [Bdellovibrionales bacterium RIFOXYC1_FULL_39_130]OFZ74190.1 MAG: hypothetical protein A2560_03430 [Bdellovibrionales bacterium RIFOXYD1_FULL_39_84]OFZ92070.1 MAG: hypothetical protein A2504_08875 [Bdellovibrionales bacterium RIFOXYD12_FULL_39_22]HLE10610.1 To
MNTILLFLVSITTLLWGNSASASAATTTFAEILKMALARNVEIKKIDNNIATENLYYRLSLKKLFLPQLDMKISGGEAMQHLKDPSTFDLATTNIRTPFALSAGLLARYDLFNGLADVNGKKMAQLSLQQSKDLLKMQKAQLTYELRKIFLDLSMAERTLALIGEEVAVDKKLFEITTAKYKSGHISKEEYWRANLEYIESQERLANQEELVKNLKIALFDLISNEQIQEKETLKLSLENYEKLDGKTNDLLTAILTQKEDQLIGSFLSAYQQTSSSDYQNLSKQMAISEMNYKISRADFLPKVYLLADYNQNFENIRDHALDNSYSSYGISLNLEVPLFSSFDSYVKSKESYYLFLNSTYDLAQNSFAVKNKISKLCSNLRAYASSYQLVQKKHEIQGEIYQNMFKRYSAGAIAIQLLIDDKIKLQQYGLQLAEEIHNIKLTELELDKISGEINRYWEQL